MTTIDTYALSSLTNVKALMNISVTTDDDLLIALINRASDKIESYCGRQFMSREYREWRSGRGQPEIVLKNRPVSVVKMVAYGSQNAMSVRATTSTDVRATIEVQDDKISLSRFDSTGAETAISMQFGTYKTASAMATAISLQTGWSATLSNECLTLDMHRLAGMDAKAQTIYLTFPDQYAGVEIVDEDQGIIQLKQSINNWFWNDDDEPGHFPRGKRNLLVQYTGGYTTVPDDLEQSCIEFVQDMYGARGRDSQMQSESLGDYAYSLAQATDLSDRTRNRLEFYREIR